MSLSDPLHARCLVLDDGKTRVAFVVVDTLEFRGHPTQFLTVVLMRVTVTACQGSRESS